MRAYIGGTKLDDDMTIEEFKAEHSEIDEQLILGLQECEANKAFLDFCKARILEPNEYQEVIDSKTNKVAGMFIKKTGYYKLKKVFGITIETVDYKFYVEGHNRLVWCYFIVKATARNGESIEAVGACDSSEKGKSGSNDITGTAHTRAILRGISQLIDNGNVSNDEIARKKKEEIDGSSEDSRTAEAQPLVSKREARRRNKSKGKE